MRNAFGRTLNIIPKIYSITLTNGSKSNFQNNNIKIFEHWPNRRRLMSTNLNIFRVKEFVTH